MFSPRHNSVYSKSALCIYHHQFNTFCRTEYFYKTVFRVQDLMKVSETGLKKTTKNLGVGEGKEYMTSSTFWFHYLDHSSNVPVVYPASFLYHKYKCQHSGKGK